MPEYFDFDNVIYPKYCDSPVLSIDEFINEIGYTIDKNSKYIVWESFKDCKWYYVDENILKFIKKKEDKYNNIIKNNFILNKDYKILNKLEFKELLEELQEEFYIECMPKDIIIEYLVITQNCFKASLNFIHTKKAKKLIKCYNDQVKIYESYSKYLKHHANFMLYYFLEEEKLNIKNKIDKHLHLLYRFGGNNCIYIIQLEGKFIKIGETNNLKNDFDLINNNYGNKCLILNVYYKNHFRSSFNNIIYDLKEYLFKEKINGLISENIILLNNDITYNKLISVFNRRNKYYRMLD